MDSHLHLLSRYHRHGDAAAFGVLVREHAGMVFATAKRVTGDAALAEDVAQETFLELARSGKDSVQSVAAWLHRVAWRKACNMTRGESRRRRNEQQAAEERQSDYLEPAWEDLEPQIDAALNDLPVALRELLVAHFLEGRAQKELALNMGVSQSTVSRKLEAGVSELRVRLRSQGLFCGAGLAVLLGAQSAQASPASLLHSLGKLALSGAGAGSTASTSAFTSTALITMSTTTKILLAATAAAVLTVPVALQQWPVKNPRQQMAPAKPPVQVQQAAAGPPRPAAGPRHYRPAPVSAKTRQTVDAILKRHAGMSAAQLKKSKELNQLMDRFIAVMSAPDFQSRFEERIAALPAKGERGMVTMNFNLLDDAKSRAWLEAAVSEDEELMQEWVLNTLDDAIFEFAFDPDLERTSNGVSVLPKPAPVAVPVETDE